MRPLYRVGQRYTCTVRSQPVRIGMKIYTIELGHMTKMATMSIYGKKSSSPEPIDQWPSNLVCSIVYGSTTKVVQIMTLG